MDGYDKDREDFNNNARGRIWESGTDRFYRDRENGYVKPPQSREHWTPEGFRRYDKEKVNEKGQILAVEDKSGSMTGENDRRELEKDRFLLERGIIEHLILRSVGGESVSKECRELLVGLRRDFPDKFTHLEISRSDAREVWAKGLAIERGKGQQLELSGVRDKAREGKEKALDNRRKKIAEIAKVRDRKERARERLAKIHVIVRAKEKAERFQQMQRLRDGVTRGRAEAPQRIQTERVQQTRERAERAKARDTPEVQRIHAERIAAEKAVREFQDRLQSGPAPSSGKAPEKASRERETPDAARARVEREARDRVLREFPFPVPVRPQERETVEIGERPTPELADAASAEREVADKARAAEKEQQAREAAREQDAARNAAYERLQERGRLTEVERLAWLGQATDPRGAVREPPGHAPSVERGGTGQAQGRDRGQSRDR